MAGLTEEQSVAAKGWPLAGVRVLELGSLIAGPFAGRLMAEFGAEVIKVEEPDRGDPLRTWRYVDQRTGTSLWWPLQSRNKKLISLNLRRAEGIELAKKLIARCDVVLENFKPGTLEKLGLGWDVLHRLNPGLILTRISGFGQTGPYGDRPGFGSVGEAIGGLRFITGDPDRLPVRVGVSIGDSLGALYSVIGTLMALRARDKAGEGQVVDVALYEAVFSLMESVLPEYDVAGIVRERTGTALPGIAPTNTYPTADGSFVVIAGNSDPIFRRLAHLMGQPELATDARFATNAARAAHSAELDRLIGDWTSSRPAHEVLALLDQAQVPASPIYSIADIVDDPHFRAREMIREDVLPGIGAVKMPGIVPKLSATAGKVSWYGGEIGAHNGEVYGQMLGLPEAEIARLKQQGII